MPHLVYLKLGLKNDGAYKKNQGLLSQEDLDDKVVVKNLFLFLG
jgi:hypothetical protein